MPSSAHPFFGGLCRMPGIGTRKQGPEGLQGAIKLFPKSNALSRERFKKCLISGLCFEPGFRAQFRGHAIVRTLAWPPFWAQEMGPVSGPWTMTFW